ncbi:piggyBac transposable element-derived protein 4-like [Gigantopelta aegis]|uniref:piggyBac transposable element-derived protein 4-like n=1 Tax=Gigantopelta aegis TaxID=1735272 RepID=UPI001B88D1AD|nr:piggyBac transposable element-derived protein 4-like [Gigantopelta aegis]
MIGVAGDVEVVVEDEVVVTVVLGDEVVVVVTGKEVMELNRGYQWMTSKLTFHQQLSHSATGFILNIIPYTGGETKDIYLSNCNPELPSLTQIVLALVENYLHKGHHIYADRLYSSVPLVDELERCNTGYTGTFVRTRQQLPSVVRGKSFKLNKGETKAWRDGEKLVLAWRDKGKPTVMISTVYQGSMTTVRGHRGETREKPLVVDKYNQSMGGVDIADQYGCYYSFEGGVSSGGGSSCSGCWRSAL